MRKLLVILGLLAVASMVLAACQPQTIVETVIVEGNPQVIEVVATPVPQEKPALLRVNLGTYPDVIDPQKWSFVNEIAHLKLFYEGLTKFDEKLETVPGAAESWTYNADATQLVFTLRPGLVYSDGTPLNAARFEYAFQRNIDPATAGEYASITDEIVGAPEWRAADTTAEGYDPEAFKAALGVKASHADGAACTGYDDAECNQDKVEAVIDSTQAGRNVREWLGDSGRYDIPIVASLSDALGFLPRANGLLIGIAPTGGKLPDDWRATILAAIRSGLDIHSGLHTFLGDDPELAEAARTSGVRLVDYRRPPERLETAIGRRHGIGKRVILTVGTDCAIGKMSVALEVRRAGTAAGQSVAFVPTGQTGMMVDGWGVAIDRIASPAKPARPETPAEAG